MGEKLNLGIVDGLDYMPLIEAIESGDILMGVNLIKDTPKGLHDKFLAGEIDIAPLPTIEYAEHFNQCVILPDLSLTTIGAVTDLLLFSKVPISQLQGKTIAVSIAAEGTQALLHILMDHYYEIDVNYVWLEPNLDKMLEQADAALLNADRALIAREQYVSYHLLDLGKLWQDFTKEPFVSTLWLAREDYAVRNPVQLELMAKALQASMEIGMKNISRLVDKAKERYNLSGEMVEQYFASFQTKFDHSCRKALLRYFAHAQICGIIPPKVTLKIWGES